MKILYAGTLTGPDWHFKRVLEQVITSLVISSIFTPKCLFKRTDYHRSCFTNVFKVLYFHFTRYCFTFNQSYIQVFQAGVMQMDVWFVTTKLVLPVVVTQLHLLCIPYTLCSALPYLGTVCVLFV